MATRSEMTCPHSRLLPHHGGNPGAGMTFAKLELLAGAVILVMAAIFRQMQ